MPPRDIILLAEDDLDNRIYVAHSRILEESLLPVSQRYKRHNIKFHSLRLHTLHTSIMNITNIANILNIHRHILRISFLTNQTIIYCELLPYYYSIIKFYRPNIFSPSSIIHLVFISRNN